MAVRTADNIRDVVASRMCHGCGTCAYVCPNKAIELRDFIDEGIRPLVDLGKCERCGDCMAVCSGMELSHEPKSWPTGVINELTEGWGPVLEVWEGHAIDEEIRFAGSSGGVVTALAVYCIEREEMRGALHVRMDPDRPYLNRTVLSRSRPELVAGAGSRYAPAAVCAGLGMIEDAPGPCMVIAKPCDIAAAQKACRIRPKLDRNLALTVSIFCGGTPSTRGTLKFLEALGVDKNDIRDLRYRGHGWPGMTGVSLRKGSEGRVEMTYREAWDNILTGHKPWRCHACPDHTGEFADLACGDPWYRPIEEGEKGSSLIVVRTELGRRILHRAIRAGFVFAEPRQPDVLPRSQASLINGRRHVFPKALALWLVRSPCFRARGFSLCRGWLRLPFKRILVSFIRALRYAATLKMSGPLCFNERQIREAEPVREALYAPTLNE